ncbi:hypothetical protein [Streptomyces sp. NPDC006638]|uniref:DUF6919 domain-containing protein n=1 Tax=Streptomyces sp. NPDC006638 TaxID=3157183 RepID=UPI0033B44DCE
MSTSRMSPADARRWRKAGSFTDITELTARWLEGKIGSFPENLPNCGPDEETRPLIPALTTLCRAGYLTTTSQPGLDEVVGGRHWQQRAAVTGVVRDGALHRRLMKAARGAGLLVASREIAVTVVNGVEYTWFGGCPDLRFVRECWSVTSSQGRDEVTGALPLTIVSPHYGPAGQNLWNTLVQAVS